MCCLFICRKDYNYIHFVHILYSVEYKSAACKEAVNKDKKNGKLIETTALAEQGHSR